MSLREERWWARVFAVLAGVSIGAAATWPAAGSVLLAGFVTVQAVVVCARLVRREARERDELDAGYLSRRGASWLGVAFLVVAVLRLLWGSGWLR